jgi:D-lyxose ketol-isomerase
MITRAEFMEACEKALKMMEAAGIHLAEEEKTKITAADFGLSHLQEEGIQILTMFETERVAGKILVLFPNQTIPEHWHPAMGDDPGKEEIIRAISGDLYFFIPGESNLKHGFIVAGKEDFYTMRHEVVLHPGEQLILTPGTRHWFQAGERGAVLYSFSTKVRDTLDQFSDPAIVRETEIVNGS